MAPQELKRKLTAILSADVKGYSRLMGENEEATIQALTTCKELMTHLIERHHGRVVDAPGDNVLAEFASVVDAVRCAVEIQEELKERNKELSEDRRMAFRIGVNLGDAVEECLLNPMFVSNECLFAPAIFPLTHNLNLHIV